jgi:hypothetical protein
MDEPKTLRFEHVRQGRLSALHAPHTAPLTRFVEELRQQMGDDFHIPDFDPFDGGIHAKVLFLLEAPGPKAKGSGFISRDNPDPAAANIWVLSHEAGLNRTDCVIWNVCPWYVGTASGIRAVKAAQIRATANALRSLLGQLADLRCLALVGRKAQKARHTVEGARPDVQIVEMPHPGNQNLSTRPHYRPLAWRACGKLQGSRFKVHLTPPVSEQP